MDRIRIVGRRRDAASRCAVCHGAEQGAFTFCPACGASAHEECVREMASGRCPTLGCSGRPPIPEAPGPSRASRPPSPRAERARADRRAARDAELQPRGDRPRPSSWARFGPFFRLTVSGVFHAALLAGIVAAVVAVAANPGEAWAAACRGKHGHVSVWNGLFGAGCFSTMILLFGAIAATWLYRLPSVWREVGELLVRDEPIPMRLRIEVTGSGKHRKTWAHLEGRAASLRLELGGILPPGWLSSVPPNTVVWVYGYPPPGPYLIELPDGRLALVHRD